MTKSDVKAHYQTFSYLNLVLGILFILFSQEIEWPERILGSIIINIGYHLLYFFFSSLSVNTMRVRKLNRFNQIGIRVMLKIFSVYGIISSFLLVFTFIYMIIVLKEYEKFFALLLPVGVFLGSYSLWLDMRNN